MGKGKTLHQKKHQVATEQQERGDKKVPTPFHFVTPQVVGAGDEGDTGEDQGYHGEGHVDILQECQLLGELLLAESTFFCGLNVHVGAEVENSQQMRGKDGKEAGKKS